MWKLYHEYLFIEMNFDQVTTKLIRKLNMFILLEVYAYLM